MTRLTADVAIGAVLIVLAWCCAQALAGEPALDAQLRAPVYAVGAPVATTVPVSSLEGAVPSASTLPPPSSGSGAVVAFTADRGTAVQVTPTAPALLVIPHYDEWVALARCESGGDWSINTGNGYYGGLQFALTSWRGAGGLQYAARPDLAGAAEQMLTAETLLSMQGWRAWPSCSRRVGLL